MAVKNLLFAVAYFILALTQVSGLQTVNGKIKITVGTTAGCGDTVRFIGNQLAEAYSLYSDFLEIEFVPWGRATKDDNEVISCQFGINDCWANRLHRCVLNMLKGNQDAQVRYMTCEFTPPRPSFLLTSYQCAEAAGLSLDDVDYCVANPERDDLDSTAHAAAIEPVAQINFIPYIIFNDAIDLNLQTQAMSRLVSVICFALSEDPSTGITDCQISLYQVPSVNIPQ